ncbi:MAG: class I adenylate-forming enzyme family protein, partial [Ilumatobacteraceae bacterium]
QWSLDAQDVHLVCSPLYHSAPLRFSISTLLAGGSLIIPGPFEVGRITAAINEAHPTTTFCTPAHLQRMAAAGCLEEFSKLRLVLHAGSPCEASLKRQAITQIGENKLWEFYGSTEGQFTVCSSSEWLERPGTVGRARQGRSISVDESGIIWCRAPNYARWEYWRDPERTKSAWRGDWFTVGDIGHFDQDGYLFLSGRRDDLIISGGVNVYPVEVETILRQFAGIEDIVIFPRDDERWGNRVCAAVVGEISEPELRKFASEHLASFKCPKEYHVVRSIPRSALDKVIRSRMSEDLGLDSRRK